MNIFSCQEFFQISLVCPRKARINCSGEKGLSTPFSSSLCLLRTKEIDKSPHSTLVAPHIIITTQCLILNFKLILIMYDLQATSTTLVVDLALLHSHRFSAYFKQICSCKLLVKIFSLQNFSFPHTPLELTMLI